MDIELLAQRERELEEALAARNDFLGLVSHELRTPIAIISANVELMRRAVEQDDRERLGDIHSEMNENIDRISRTVDNMLALARIEAGTISDPEPVLPARLAERVAASHRRWHPGRVITVIDNSSLRPVLSHADHIEQALDNLLSNALKYSEGPIEIEVIEVRPGPIGSGAASSDVADTASNESWITAHVRDRGPGIPADVVGALFQPFTRSDEHASVAGIGLGLNVCRRLIEVHHGRIWAENRPDGGADFAFSLPAAPFD
ncbi:MAG: HAMP domain-containing sensor histidine kinase [Chloroflexota bacterium]